MTKNDDRTGGLRALLDHDAFHARHLGTTPSREAAMLAAIGRDSREALIRDTVPAAIRLDAPLALPDPVTEASALAELKTIAAENAVWRSYIGAGYHGTITPEPIRRNVLENPGWYTAYTPYQAEISQGRLEALLNFQQMIVELTGLAVANAGHGLAPLLAQRAATAVGNALQQFRPVETVDRRYRGTGWHKRRFFHDNGGRSGLRHDRFGFNGRHWFRHKFRRIA